MTIRVARKEDLETIQKLANRIWPVAYRKMISTEQINYMLKKMYDLKILEKNQSQEGHVFVLAYDKEKLPVGYASFSTHKPFDKKTVTYKLHKLYILPPMQKKGIGKKMLKFIQGEIKKPCMLVLNVNRENPSVEFYKNLGFEILKEEDVKIGGGFEMNDYVMGKMIKA